MAPSDFRKADIPSVVEKLTLEEAVSLTAGVGSWRTHAVPRLGIPAIKVSDGPNGVRGNFFFMGTPAKCLPSATALGATWDPALIRTVGSKLLAPEAKLRSASVILAPTCNIQRSPLGGRSFESFSEDPFLSGMLAASYIAGIQSEGVGTTIKHFVANDKENDRMAYDSIVMPRALREIYLLPFMLAEKYAKPWSYMTAYNRLNGIHMSENAILKNILRDEWKSDATIMSDWFGVYSVAESINAGVDLEMPGPNKWRTWDKVSRSVGSRKLTQRTIKERAAKVLELVKKCANGAPEILDGDGKERTSDKPEDEQLMRKVAAESLVLLKNEENLLPLNANELKKVAIVGANAKSFIISGGGSASLKPSYFVSPFDGIVKALGPNVEVTYNEGARAFKTLPSLDFDIFTEGDKRCFTGRWYSNSKDILVKDDTPVKEQIIDETTMLFGSDTPEELTPAFTLELRGHLKPREKDEKFEFGLTVCGRGKLFVDGQLVVDNWTRQRRGEAFFGFGTVEEKGVAQLKAGVAHEILIQFVNVSGPADGDESETIQTMCPALRVGGAPVENSDEAMNEAIKLASEADIAIVIVGLNGDWETEGHDRTTLALPGRTDELVEKVVKANKKTVVVTQSGSAITMPWIDQVSTLLHSWYLGNATGDSIADVLFGKVNPAGKLPLTFPKRLEDVPSFGHFHSENGKILYAEDLFVGYKHYQHVKVAPLFPFGYGKSYTSFSLTDLRLTSPKKEGNDVKISVSVSVKNVGSVAGSETVQLYIAYPTSSELTHPPLVLKAFSKVHDLAAGESRTVTLDLDKYAFSYWEARINSWVIEDAKYGIFVGTSSENLPLRGEIALDKSHVFEWNGL